MQHNHHVRAYRRATSATELALRAICEALGIGCGEQGWAEWSALAVAGEWI